MSDHLPEFIIAGEWVDPNANWNPILGPRSHPYGPDAWEATVQGVRRIYPDRAAAERHAAALARAAEGADHVG